MTLLLCLKLKHPQRITLLRGNHESRYITKIYGLYTECLKKYGNVDVWRYLTDTFDYLTIAALIDNKIFCVHGGISPAIANLDQIRVLERFQEVPQDGPLADLLWSDPDTTREGFGLSQRGAGYTFGQDVIKKFVQANSIDHIMRANQLCMNGYQILFNDMLSTVWSAPNYSYRCGNVAAICEIDSNLNRFYNTWDASPETRAAAAAAKKADMTSDAFEIADLPEYFL